MPLPAWLKAQKGHAGPWLSFAVGLGLCGGLLVIAQAWLLARTVDAVMFQAAGLPQVSPWLWGMLALFLLRALVVWASEQSAFRAAARVKLHLRNRLYRQLQALGPIRLGERQSGDLVNSLTDGIEALEAYYARFLPALSLMALVPLSILVFVFPSDWIAGLIMLITAPLIPLFMVLIGKGAERLNQKQWRKLSLLSARFLDVIQGITTLKLYNASIREAETVARLADDYRHGTMAVLKVAFLSSLALEFFATVSIAVVAVSIGFRLLWGEMSFLPGFFVLLLAPEFYLPLRNMGTHYHARMEAIGAAERISEILGMPIAASPTDCSPCPDPARHPIHFDDVHFAYGEGRAALKGLSMELRPGRRIALVGPSGGGKSSLFRLLLGFVSADRGRILIGDTPLQEVDPRTWRRHLAWVPQNPRLFHGSILDNLRLGNPDASEAQVREAAAQVRAHEFIEALPQGYATLVGERGQGLSGGQIQRIALARALLRNAPLVLLDEATAGLDPDNERLVQAGITALARGRSLLIIAHRLHTVRNADQILVIHDGRVAEQGRHEQLLRLGGVYHRMLSGAGATP